MNRRHFLSSTAGMVAASMTPPTWAQSEPIGDLTSLNLQQASDLVHKRQVSPVELTKACLARIEKYDGSINAFITVASKLALNQAKVAEREIMQGHWRGPLHGIPIALKDMIDTVDIRTTAASAVFANRIPTEDAEVVRRLKRAGAVILGKLNMDEFANGISSVSSHWGPVHNPWSLSHSVSGSSGGSGAAVAADFCYGALGTDTGGSVRRPAAHCGIVGFISTCGLVSNRGVLPTVESLDRVGPMGKTVGDIALLLEVISGFDPDWIKSVDAATENYFERMLQTPANMRVGLPAGYFDRLDAEVKETIMIAIQVLKSLSVDVCNVTPPDVDWSTLSGIVEESYVYHKPLLAQAGELYHPYTYHMPFVNQKYQSKNWKYGTGAYIEARNLLEKSRREINGFFKDIDFLVAPTLRFPPFTIDYWETAVNSWLAKGGTGNFYEGLELPGDNTGIANVYGLPAISIPCGFTKAGLPIGMQIIGAPFTEAKVLALAHAYERETKWHLYKPNLEV